MGFVAAVVGLIGVESAPTAEPAATGAYAATVSTLMPESEGSTAAGPAPRSWLSAAVTTTAVTAAGTERRPDSDSTLPAAVDDAADHRFTTATAHREPGTAGAPRVGPVAAGGSRAPPSPRN